MKLVLKYGGTSISTARHIKEVAKHINKLSKQNKIVIVCSAISGITDDLLEKHQLIIKGKKTNASMMSMMEQSGESGQVPEDQTAIYEYMVKVIKTRLAQLGAGKKESD